MKIVREERIIERGAFPLSDTWKRIRAEAVEAIRAAEWPVGSGIFTIYPESGKKTGRGNGVKPIKNNVIAKLTGGKKKFRELVSQSLLDRASIIDKWVAEYPWPVEDDELNGGSKPGCMDAAYVSQDGIVCFEWETGNISSSHRSLNKMCLGLLKGSIKGGILVVPSRELYVYLTDRIGNISELEPYFDLWRSIPCTDGVLDIIVIEHDAISFDVPRIPKGTDGRALV